MQRHSEITMDQNQDMQRLYGLHPQILEAPDPDMVAVLEVIEPDYFPRFLRRFGVAYPCPRGFSVINSINSLTVDRSRRVLINQDGDRPHRLQESVRNAMSVAVSSGV